MKSNKTVLGIVDNQSTAEVLLNDLDRAGFNPREVSVLLADRRGTRDFAVEHHTKSPEGAAAGVAGGGLVGGAIGLLAGIGALAIPGLGPFIAAGPVMGALSGAAAGAAVGGIAGALIGWGIPEMDAKRHGGKVQGGSVLVAVHVENDEWESLARDVLGRNGAHDITTTSDSSISKSQRESRSDVRQPRARLDSQI